MRHTDPENTTRSYFRSQTRLFMMNGSWYFSTREGDNGPFGSRQQAVDEVARYIKGRRDLERFQARLVRRKEPDARRPRFEFERGHGISLEDLMRRFQH
jgi:hypothetical protein